MAEGSSKTSAHLPEYTGHIPEDRHFYVIFVKMSNIIFKQPVHSTVLQNLNITSTKVNKKPLKKGGDNKIQLRVIPKCFQTRT